MIDSQTLEKLFIDDLIDEESEAFKAELNEEYQKNCDDIKQSCLVLGETLAITVYDFFESFYRLVQQAPAMLDVTKVVSEFKLVKNKGENLKDIIKKDVGEDHELLVFLEEYLLTLDNRVTAIETEQEHRNSSLESAIEQNIFLEEIDGDMKLVLNIKHHVQDLIGMNGLLNYQIKQLVETNNMVYAKLIEQAKKYGKKVVIIRDASAEELNEEKKQEFLDYVEDDKALLNQVKNIEDLNEEQQEELLEIAEELTCSLVYKICWADEIEIEVE